MQVRLTVVRGRGAPEPLEVQAISPEDARARARELGYLVLSAGPARAEAERSVSPAGRRAPLDVAVFVEQLRDLLGAGLSVIEALDAQRRGAKGAAALAIDNLVRQLCEGRTLSSALAADTAFPALLVALVKASELTSDLAQSLTRYLEHDARVKEVRHRVVSTSIYPSLLVGVGGLVLAFLLFYVMPRFARVFEGMSGELPWSAKAMVAWSQNLHAHSLWWGGAGVCLLLLAAAIAASARLRARAIARVFDLPLLREPMRVYFLARWYRATGLLVQGGIPLPQALRLSGQVLPPGLQAGGARVEEYVASGLSPAGAYARASMVTPVAEQLMLAGERTGDLGMVLSRIAQYHEAEVSRALERGIRTLEPVVMVLIGLGVGIVVVLMYMPIFELASAVQ